MFDHTIPIAMSRFERLKPGRRASGSEATALEDELAWELGRLTVGKRSDEPLVEQRGCFVIVGNFEVRRVQLLDATSDAGASLFHELVPFPRALFAAPHPRTTTRAQP